MSGDRTFFGVTKNVTDSPCKSVILHRGMGYCIYEASNYYETETFYGHVAVARMC